MPDLKAPYVDARDRLVALTDGLSYEGFNRKPSPKGWSAGECVVHLNTMAKGYLPRLEEAAAREAPRGTPPFRYGWVSRQFIKAVTPGSRPLPTGGAMKPPASEPDVSSIDMDRALERFLDDTDRYLAVVDAAAGLDLARIKVQSPFLSVLTLPLGAAVEAMGLHSLRHVLQAERAVAAAR